MPPCCNSVFADVKTVISARDFAKSSRVFSQPAASTAAARHATATLKAQGHLGRAARVGVGGNSNVGAGIESRTSLTMRDAKLSRVATMKRRTSTD
jgi:hypothetical protein